MNIRQRWCSALCITSFATVACAPKPPAPPPPPNVVMMKASDFAYDGPAQIPAGVTTFKLANAGTTFHHMIIARIDSGKTFADAKAAFAKPGPPPAWLTVVGGPNAPDPGAESNATLDMRAGEYVVFCMVDIPGGVPHVAKGMLKQLTVTPATGAAAVAPVADVNVTLSDYTFAVPATLTAGKHTFAVTTSPGQVHELELIQLAPGKTADDLMKWMGGKMDTPPPGHGIGGAAPGVPGSTLSFSFDMVAGDYVMVCFMPDMKDGKPHFMKGMIKTVKVS